MCASLYLLCNKDDFISRTQGYMNYRHFTLKSPAISDCIADHKQQ